MKLESVPSTSDILLICCLLHIYWLLPYLHPTPAQAAPYTAHNAEWNVNKNPDGSQPHTYYGAWEDHTYFPSPPDWRSVGVYQLMTDRFSDGDPTNNEGRYGGYDLSSVGFRHGGDFKGLMDRLDYIKGLGYSAIWISPVFQNLHNSYHGYGQIDFTVLDDRFGTLEELRALVNAAHERGMYVIVDVVVNHLSNLYFAEGYRTTSPPFRFHDGEYRLFPRDDNSTYKDFQVVNEFVAKGSYCDVFDSRGFRHRDPGRGSYWHSDLHHNGALTDYYDPWNVHLGKIYNLYDDLRTTHKRVQRKITAMTKSLIASTDIDGIRVDTPMQVPRCFFEHWAPEVRAYARTLGKENFFIFGETYCVPPWAATMLGRGKSPPHYGKSQFISDRFALDAGIHYWFYKSFIVPALFKERQPALEQLLSDDRQRYDLVHPHYREWRYRMLNFYNNHDQRRLATAAYGSKKSDLAAALIAVWPGIPLFYYGDAQGFNSYGTALEGHAREDMMTSLAWQSHPAVSTPNPAQGDNFDMTHPRYRWVQRVMNIRAAYPVLQRGEQVTFHEPPSHAAQSFAYTRAVSGADSAALVLLNWGPRSFSRGGEGETLNTVWTEVELVNVLQPDERYMVDDDGLLPEVRLKPFEIKVLLPRDAMQPLSPVVEEVAPVHDALLAARDTVVPVRLSFSKEMDVASVKRAVRVNGAPLRENAVTCTQGRLECRVSVNIADGITVVEVLPRAESVDELPLLSTFRVRYRRGSPRNVIAHPPKITDAALINQGAHRTESINVQLFHRAEGAKKLRVSNDHGKHWSPWQPYTQVTDWKLNNANGWQTVFVQYWADGSAAYFVEDGIDRFMSDGISAVSAEAAK